MSLNKQTDTLRNYLELDGQTAALFCDSLDSVTSLLTGMGLHTNYIENIHSKFLSLDLKKKN